ncbi:FAD/FMN_dependent oxidoreductase [Hexamita inflata]|uniref:FAD/FMN dependent oxidoreductase n=1 Tax=Hexamita inflata TaxID=28002 RepID=A0AA86P3G8_9EUKA|nr:FAD/FMN dependent oxidoreductase [Hexamita inflata]
MNFIKSATSEGLADADGVTHSEYVNLYRHFAKNRELSIIITGHIAVSREGRPEARCVFLTDGEGYPYKLRTRNLRRMTEAVHSENPSVKIIAQLNHGGRQIPRLQLRKNKTSICCSPIQKKISKSGFMFKTPNQTPQSCKYIKDQFVIGAKQMEQAGFDGVQIHCAHGYLLHDCIKAGLIQFVMEILTEIKDQCKGILMIKVNADEDNLKFINEAIKIVDIVELSKGSYDNPNDMIENHRSKPAACFIEQHQELTKQKAKICVTGGFHTREEGQNVLMEQICHYVGFGRLYLMPQITKVQRISFGRVVQACSKFMPLINAGPATVFYEEEQRRIAKKIAVKNEDEMKRVGVLWWFVCLIISFLGFQRYNTIRDMTK